MKQVSFSKYEKFQKALAACCQFLIFPVDHFEDNEGYTTLNQFQYRGYNQLPKNKYCSIKNTIKSVEWKSKFVVRTNDGPWKNSASLKS